MSKPSEKIKRLMRIHFTDRIVKRRQKIVRIGWGIENPDDIFCAGKLRKYNLVCSCNICKKGKQRSNKVPREY